MSLHLHRYAIIAALVAVPTVASADPDDHGKDHKDPKGPVATKTNPTPREPGEGKPANSEPPAPPEQHTAGSVAGAPLPGNESGMVAGKDGGDGAGRIIARGVLFIPRAAFELAMAPIRAGVWAEYRYHLADRVHDWFFDKTNTYGIYPTARWESDFGVNAGARFVHRDLFGHKEHLSVFAGGGGRFREVAQAGFRTGDLFGKRVGFEAEGVYERRPQDRFFGIGNGSTATSAMIPIDPRFDDTSVETRYRKQIERVALVGDVRVVSGLHVRAAEALTDLNVGASEMGVPIDQVYDPNGLVGFDGSRSLYSELELRWDDRSHGTKLEAPSIPALGGLTGLYVGRTHRLDGGPDYWRLGFDVQQLVRVSKGPRLLLLRAHGEGVSLGRDDVPFTDLPSLGGSRFLRGYPTDRFRDRVAAVGSAEYQWDLLRALQAGVFVDVGRVYETVHHLSFDGMRMGYGATVQWFGDNSMWLRATVASSIDGGLEFYLSFDPVTDLDRRVERR